MNERTLDNIAIIIFGVLFIGGSLFCFFTGSFSRTERSRWEAAPLVQEAGELRTIGEGNDVALTGSIAPDTPEVIGGLVLFERWEYKRSPGESTRRWKRTFFDHKPAFELLLGEQRVVVHSAEAVLVYAREVRESYSRKLVGFAPDDEVTVLGTVTLAGGSPQVRAKYICGSNKEACLKYFSPTSGFAVAAGVLLFLLGGGLIGLGIVRLRAQRRRPKPALAGKTAISFGWRLRGTKRVFGIVFRYAAVWLLFILIPTLAGQPEVIFMTPFGLILALVAGTGVLIPARKVKLTWEEAILVGAMVGAFQGLLFGIWTPLVEFKQKGDELINALLMMSCACAPGGIVTGGLLGAILGAIGHGIRAFGNVLREKRAMTMEVTKAEVIEPGWSPETTEAPEELPEDERTVPELIQALSDQSAKARARAALALGTKGDKQAVPHLIQALGDKSPKVREAAAWALGRLGDEQAVPHLIQALNDKRWQMRAKAVEALGYIGDKSALPHLVRALNDRKSGVRMVAAEALARLGDKRAVPHLAQALNTNRGRVLLKVGWALGRLGGVFELSRALKDRNWKVRKAAVVGLGAAGWKAVPFLLRALNDELQEVREQAAVALNRLGLPVRCKKRKVKLSPVVLGRIRKDFPPQSQAEAIALVERYLERDREHGRNLVYKIVVLSEGSIASLSSLTETALADYRDILYFWQMHKRRGK